MGEGREERRRTKVERWTKCAKTRLGLVGALLIVATGCTGMTIVRTNPPDAKVTVDGRPLQGNFFEYGRWIGNKYRITASAPGYKTSAVDAHVHLGSRAGIVAFYSLISIVGAPNILALPWYGQLDDEIYIELQSEEPKP